MSLDLFNKLLDELGEVLLTVILYSWGEPFLNRDLCEMVKSCTRRDILTLTSTNGNVVLTEDDALRVVDSGLSALIIALDGSTQEIYQAYRIGGDLEKVKRFTALIQEAKAKRFSKRPYTNLRVVVNNRNQDDLSNIESIARNLEVDLFSIKSIGDLTENTPFSQLESDNEEMRRYPCLSNGGRRGEKTVIKCPYPFRQPTVFWDGTVVGCEFDYKVGNSWGNIVGRGFADIWNSTPALRHRKAILKTREEPAFCGSRCPYRGRVQNSSIVQRIQIQ